MPWPTREERCGTRALAWQPGARESVGFDEAAERAARAVIGDVPKPSIDTRSLLKQRARDRAEIARLRAEVERLSSPRAAPETPVPTDVSKAFRHVMSVEFEASLTPTSSAGIIVRELAASPIVKALARGLEEEGNLPRLRSSVARIVKENFRKNIVFPYSTMLSAVAVALMHNTDPLADQYLDELSRLSGTPELSEAGRVAVEVLRGRRSMAAR